MSASVEFAGARVLGRDRTDDFHQRGWRASRSCRYAVLTWPPEAGSRSGRTADVPEAQSGRSGFPLRERSAHAAGRAAPTATYSRGAGTVTGASKMLGAISCTARERAAPP